MRHLPLALATALSLAAGLAVAASPPQRDPGTLKLPPKKPSLTVRYVAHIKNLKLVTEPASEFSCTTKPPAAVGLMPVAECTMSTKEKAVTLYALRPSTIATIYVVDGQWAGDCAGTKGAACKLDLTTPKTVTIQNIAP